LRANGGLGHSCGALRRARRLKRSADRADLGGSTPLILASQRAPDPWMARPIL